MVPETIAAQLRSTLEFHWAKSVHTRARKFLQGLLRIGVWHESIGLLGPLPPLVRQFATSQAAVCAAARRDLDASGLKAAAHGMRLRAA